MPTRKNELEPVSKWAVVAVVIVTWAAMGLTDWVTAAL